MYIILYVLLLFYLGSISSFSLILSSSHLKAGTGIIVTKLPGGRGWSAPSAIYTGIYVHTIYYTSMLLSTINYKYIYIYIYIYIYYILLFTSIYLFCIFFSCINLLFAWF
jgi:hypothetical protein